MQTNNQAVCQSKCFYVFRVMKQLITEETAVLGGTTLKMPNPQDTAALEDFFQNPLPPGPLATIYRAEHRGTVCYSRQYERIKKRNSYTIMYRNNDGRTKFGLIDYFVFIQQKLVAVIKSLLPASNCRLHFELAENF